MQTKTDEAVVLADGSTGEVSTSQIDWDRSWRDVRKLHWESYVLGAYRITPEEYEDRVDIERRHEATDGVC